MNTDIKAGDDLIQVTLHERAGTHGEFKDNAFITFMLRDALRRGPNWGRLQHEQQLALEEIALKMARILSKDADPGFQEHWLDIAGYAMLGNRACENIPKAKAAEPAERSIPRRVPVDNYHKGD